MTGQEHTTQPNFPLHWEIFAMEKTTRIGDLETSGRLLPSWRYPGKASKRGLQSGGLLFLLGVLVGLSGGTSQTDVPPVKGAYWPSGFHTVFPAESIPSKLYTHLFFAFVGIDSSTSRVVPGSPVVAELLANFSAIVKVANPFVKTLVSIGGGGFDPVLFANMTATRALRSAFINSSIALARENGFDGLDLDYEFPDSDEDMAHFSDFIDEWRAGVTAEANATGRSPLLLTAAVYYASSLIFFESNSSYPIPSITKNLDFVNLMLYDLHGSWEKTQINYNAALFVESGVLSASYGVQTWLQAGLPPSKAVFGIPAYGNSWILADVSKNTFGSAASGLGPPQNLSRQAGLFLYNEVAAFIKRDGVTVVYDDKSVSSYAYDATGVWVGYDGPESVTAKVLYAKESKLRGYFFWTVSYDDSNWSLSEAASRALDNLTPSEAPSPTPSRASALRGSSAIAGLLWVTCILILIAI